MNKTTHVGKLVFELIPTSNENILAIDKILAEL